METVKTKSVRAIEQKMEDLDKDSLRYHILDSAKNFKTSWISLGRALYSVWKDKLFKEWGFSAFEAYSAKEIGIRKDTALKLLRSYYFLEKEEPEYLKRDYSEPNAIALAPSYESVDILRKAKGKKILDEEDYSKLKEEIFEKGRDVRDARRDLTTLIRQRKELEPEEALEQRRRAAVKRLLSTLKSLKKEIELLKLLPTSFIKETATLIEKIEAEIS